MISSIAYVLSAFPQPSETFIADELLSLNGHGVKPCILHLNGGNRLKVHPSAQTLLDKAKLLRIGTASRMEAFWALGRLLIRHPVRTLRTLAVALRSPYRWCYIQALPAAEWCLVQNVEFLHAHFADQNFIYAAVIAAWCGIPYGVTTHRYDIFEDPIDKATAIDLFEGAAVVITISEFNRNYMVKKYGLPFSKIHIVHCGIDLDRFRFVERKPHQLGQTLRILNIGRLMPEKAQDILLAALAVVKERGIIFTIEIIGDGPKREELIQMVANLGLMQEVVFHGFQTELFVRERLAAVDLFVLSSRGEGLPVVLMEALAVGTPVIATRIFGIPELIEDGISGLLVEPDNAQELANKIIYLYEQQALTTAMCMAGREVVMNNFDRKKCTMSLLDSWNKAVLTYER